MFLNPFFLYSLSWLAVMLLYHLEITNLYPKLSTQLLFFVYSTIFISFLFGIFYKLKLKKYLIKEEKKYLYIYTFIYLCFILEFIIEGKVPLIENLLETGYTYKDFKGIKTFHVIIFTYNFYTTICAFNDYILTKNKKYLIYIILGIMIYILLYLRGAILMLSSCLFLIWLFYNYKLKTIIKISFLGIVFLYTFGVSGNIRHYYKWNDTSMIKEIAQIKTKESILDPFVWSYVYITSPLGNLQYNFNNTKPTNDKKYFVYENLFPDAISKRLDYNKINSKLMIENLTVSTMYIDSYLSYGKLGMWITFLVYMLCEIGYLLFLNRTKYYILGLSLVSILNIFSIFDNMFVFSGLSFCLVYPLMDIFIDKIKNKSEVE